MISTWKPCDLGDVINLQRGHDLPSQDRNSGLYPIISSAGLSGYHDEYKAKSPGVVTGRYGTIGEVFYVNTDYWPLNTTLYVNDFKGNIPRFVFYLLQCINLKDMNVAGAVPGINRNHIHKIKVKLPPLLTQTKISDALSPYDHLIENNLKRIKLLEEQMSNNYQHYFDSGNKNKKSILDFDSFVFCTSKVKRFEGEKRYIATADIEAEFITSSGEIVTFENRPSRAQVQPIINTVWFARMSNTHKIICFNSKNTKEIENIILSSGFAGFKAKNDYCLPYLYKTINSEQFSTLKNMYATGATQVSLNNESMKFIKMYEPPLDLIEKYGREELPSLELITSLKIQNEFLREARDLLLPRLMKGIIDADAIMKDAS
jgi:type I restriction enzyme S subunit